MTELSYDGKADYLEGRYVRVGQETMFIKSIKESDGKWFADIQTCDGLLTNVKIKEL